MANPPTSHEHPAADAFNATLPDDPGPLTPEQRAGVNKEQLKKDLERQRERLTGENPK
ncbi:hypothetical protein ACIKTA_09070 [Hansschlegelia beijingensis]